MLNGRPTRRQVLAAFGVASVGLSLLAACNPPAPAPSAAPTSLPAPTSPPAAAPTVTVVSAAKPTAATAAGTPATSVAPSAAGGPVVVGGVQLPTYVPFAGVQPDSPGSPDGMIDNGYKAYPATRTKSVTSPPGDGSDINIMTYTSTAIPAALDQNAGWQEVNRQVGANLKMNITPFADYFGSKLQTTIAGGELPEPI